jgi:Zn-dependent peptidase ImmA (M78 family)
MNNTIVHECVHWVLHRKVFELERLYNAEATQIKCMVVGGIKDSKIRTATDNMEWQANSLAPRIQMPINHFQSKAAPSLRNIVPEYGSSTW